MTMPPSEREFLHGLEAEATAELAMAEAGRVDGGPEQWMVDPEDVLHTEVGLRSLLGAAEALEPDGEN